MEAGLHLHSHQLLQEQFTGVGHVDLVDVLSGVTHAALEQKLFKVGFTEETTHTAHVDRVVIRHVKQPFL